MGSFNASCMVTGIEVDGDETVFFLPFIQNHLSYKENRKLDFEARPQALLKDTNYLFAPYLLPIKGRYNSYGVLDSIEEDENTKMIERHFGVPIEAFVEIAMCSRNFGSNYSELSCRFLEEKVLEKQKHYLTQFGEILDVLGFSTEVDGDVVTSSHPKCSFTLKINPDELASSSYSKYTVRYKDGREEKRHDNYNEELFALAIQEDNYFLGVQEEKQEIVRELYGISGAFVHISIYEALSSHNPNEVIKSNLLGFYSGEDKARFASEIEKLNTFMKNLNESNRILQLSKYVSETDSDERAKFHLGMLQVIEGEINKLNGGIL